MPLIPALGSRGRQISEFKDSQDNTVKPCNGKKINKISKFSEQQVFSIL